MTRADKFEQVFGYRPATDEIICNKNDWCGENDACKYCRSNSKNIGRSEDWWNAEYIEPTTKNDLGVDAVSRQAVLDEIDDTNRRGGFGCKLSYTRCRGHIEQLPSVTPQLSSELDKNSKKLENPATKNNLGVDSISRDEVCRYVAEFVNHEFRTKEEEELINNIIKGIEHMSSATPQEPKSEWEQDHAILKAHSDGANEVLDKIRAEIDTYLETEGFGSEYRNDVKGIIDKYTAESENKEKLSWLGKNCKDCGNEKCKKLGTLPKGHDCALWQPNERKIK